MRVLFSTFTLATFGFTTCGERHLPEPAGPRFDIRVAPVTLQDVNDACYSLAVYNVPKASIGAGALVWEVSPICASRYGDSEGSLIYIATCDASPSGRINTTSLVLDGLCRDEGCDPSDPNDTGVLPVDEYVNPCPTDRPCLLERPCVGNADTLVEFNLTVMRAAKQGFFDFAVNFEDIFCSAKLDCLPELLFRPGAGRDLTAVLAFACTSGGETCLYADPITITCGVQSWTIDPEQGPGNIPVDSPLLFGAAVYQGDEAYPDFEKRYWTIGLGLDTSAFSTYPNCTVSWAATAAEGLLPGNTTPPETTYPKVVWQRDIVVGGQLACGAYPLDQIPEGEALAPVRTDYVRLDDPPHTFPHDNCADRVEQCVCAGDFAPNAAGDMCVLDETASAIRNDTQWTICPAEPDNAYSMWGARFHATLTPGVSGAAGACPSDAVCVQDDDAFWKYRLNQVGVWPCGAGQTVAGTEPLNQWIGFSECIEIATAGDYLVGIAGDNHVLLRVDGVVVYEATDSLNFRAWNVFKVPLTGGTHIIELYGKNNEDVASFGAEISGPFAVGSIDTPLAMAAADYANNIVFSTGDLRTAGGSFDTSYDPTGTSNPSGTTCPAGYALDLCDVSPSCRRHTETACGVAP